MSSTPLSRIPGLTEAQHKAVEALFVQELPGQDIASMSDVSPTVAKVLVAKGYAEPAETGVKKQGHLSFRICFHKLTPKGHMAYCQWAATQPDEE